MKFTLYIILEIFFFTFLVYSPLWLGHMLSSFWFILISQKHVLQQLTEKKNRGSRFLRPHTSEKCLTSFFTLTIQLSWIQNSWLVIIFPQKKLKIVFHYLLVFATIEKFGIESCLSLHYSNYSNANVLVLSSFIMLNNQWILSNGKLPSVWGNFLSVFFIFLILFLYFFLPEVYQSDTESLGIICHLFIFLSQLSYLFLFFQFLKNFLYFIFQYFC